MYHQSLVIRGWRWSPGSPVCWVSTPPTKPRPGSSSHCVLAFTATVVTDCLRQFWAGLFSVSSGVLNCGCFSWVPRNPLIRPSPWVPATVTKFPVSALVLLIGHNFTSQKTTFLSLQLWGRTCLWAPKPLHYLILLCLGHSFPVEHFSLLKLFFICLEKPRVVSVLMTKPWLRQVCSQHCPNPHVLWNRVTDHEIQPHKCQGHKRGIFYKTDPALLGFFPVS